MRNKGDEKEEKMSNAKFSQKGNSNMKDGKQKHMKKWTEDQEGKMNNKRDGFLFLNNTKKHKKNGQIINRKSYKKKKHDKREKQ